MYQSLGSGDTALKEAYKEVYILAPEELVEEKGNKQRRKPIMPYGDKCRKRIKEGREIASDGRQMTLHHCPRDSEGECPFHQGSVC